MGPIKICLRSHEVCWNHTTLTSYVMALMLLFLVQSGNSHCRCDFGPASPFCGAWGMGTQFLPLFWKVLPADVATLTVTLLGSIPGTLFLRKPLMGKNPYCFRTSWFTGSRQDMCVLWVAYDHPFGWKEEPCHPLCLSMQQKLLYFWLQSDGRWRSEH